MKLLVLSGLLAFVNAAPSPQTHEEAVAIIKQSHNDISQPLLPEVPGLAEHQAAINALRALQGLTPVNPVHSAAEARHAQAEAVLVALQQQQAAQNAQNVAVVA